MSSPDNPQFDPPQLVSTEADPLAGEAGSTRAEAVTPGEELSVLPVPPPPRDPVWNGWDVLLIAVLAVVTLAVAELLTTAAAWIFFYSHNSYREVLQNPALGLLGEFLGYIAIAVYMVALVEGKYHVSFLQAIHWNWRWKTVPRLLGMGVLTVALDFLSRFFPMPKNSPFDELFSHQFDAYLIAVFAVTVGPLMEELFFRGFLYPVLARRTGVAVAILLTALPFGLMHYLQYRSWTAVLVVTLVGVVLTVVRAATRSVAASFLVHVGYNATLMLLTAVATEGFRHMERAVICLS